MDRRTRWPPVMDENGFIKGYSRATQNLYGPHTQSSFFLDAVAGRLCLCGMHTQASVVQWGA